MERILQFLKSNVNGKTLYTQELVYSLDDGALEGVYSDQISFSNLRASDTALQMDMFIIANEKVYGVQNGVRGKIEKDYSAVSLFRYELAQRKSCPEVTGLFRFVSASVADVPAEAVVSAIFNVRLENRALYMEEDQVLYRDQFSKNGFKPVAFVATHRFTVESGKLHFDYGGESFDVDPATRHRMASTDGFPPFHSAEK